MDHRLAQRFARLGFAVPELLLPANGLDLEKWAVIACDQHTSDPEYWREVDRYVGDAPSTLRIIYPEVYLGKEEPGERIALIRTTMDQYLSDGVLTPMPPGLMVSTRTTSAGKTRTGVNVALDLECYDFHPGSRSLIRASEETILERLPPRIRIRTGAPLEVPHVLVLIDDRELPAIAPLAEHTHPAYETQLMLNGGRVTGAWVEEEQFDGFATRLEQILRRSPADNRFLFAVGDGNHSLATAKAVWEEIRDSAGPDHPGRYALVELVSLYDPGLHFEPIHRIVRCSDPDRWVRTMLSELGGEFVDTPRSELLAAVGDSECSIGIATSTTCGILKPASTDKLPVALVQEYLNQGDSSVEVDYIHGSATALDHSEDPSIVSLILPEFDQSLLFPTIASDGVLPRKAFSLGEAADKRYYLEARRISV